jgi:hypothetical protein
VDTAVTALTSSPVPSRASFPLHRAALLPKVDYRLDRATSGTLFWSSLPSFPTHLFHAGDLKCWVQKRRQERLRGRRGSASRPSRSSGSCGGQQRAGTEHRATSSDSGPAALEDLTPPHHPAGRLSCIRLPCRCRNSSINNGWRRRAGEPTLFCDALLRYRSWAIYCWQ